MATRTTLSVTTLPEPEDEPPVLTVLAPLEVPADPVAVPEPVVAVVLPVLELPPPVALPVAEVLPLAVPVLAVFEVLPAVPPLLVEIPVLPELPVFVVLPALTELPLFVDPLLPEDAPASVVTLAGVIGDAVPLPESLEIFGTCVGNDAVGLVGTGGTTTSFGASITNCPST